MWVEGHMVSDLRINLLAITKGNGFSTTTQWAFSISNNMTNFNNKTMNTFQNMMNFNNNMVSINNQQHHDEHLQLITIWWTFTTNNNNMMNFDNNTINTFKNMINIKNNIFGL
jgi:hypothetical protein